MEWQQVLRSQEDRATELLEKQTANAEKQQENDCLEAKDFLDKQQRDFEEKIQAFTDRIDLAEKTTYTVPPAEPLDGDPGLSIQGQIDLWITTDIPYIEKQSVSTPRQNKEYQVD